MKRVALDLQPCLGQRAGIGTYTYELARRLHADGLEFVGRVFNFRGKDGLTGLDGLNMPVAQCKKFPFGVYRRIWHALPLSYDKLFGGAADLSIFFDYIVPPRVGGRILSVIHDMTYLRYPETMLARNRRRIERDIRSGVERSDRIVTVSEFSAREICALLGVPRERVAVVYNAPAVPAHAAPEREMRARFGLEGEYILYVGTIEARKNLDMLLCAFARFKRETGMPHKLVLAGGNGWENEGIYARARSMYASEDVVFTGYVSGAQKSALYKYASLFVFPSLYEGFGIPPLEAMALGCPVVCSDAASLPEVVGDAALTVKTDDEIGLAAAMRRVLSDSALAAELVRRGWDNAARFSWDDSAARLAALCKEVLDVRD